jgi:hypothetical protein
MPRPFEKVAQSSSDTPTAAAPAAAPVLPLDQTVAGDCAAPVSPGDVNLDDSQPLMEAVSAARRKLELARVVHAVNRARFRQRKVADDVAQCEDAVREARDAGERLRFLDLQRIEAESFLRKAAAIENAERALGEAKRRKSEADGDVESAKKAQVELIARLR